MIIIDASALTHALTDDGRAAQRNRAELARDPHWTAPEHLVVETFSAIRGRHLGGRTSTQRALDALDALTASVIELLMTTPLLPRMWQLRDNVSGYDAAYIAAAETLDCPLVRADSRLARNRGPRCEVRLACPPPEPPRTAHPSASAAAGATRAARRAGSTEASKPAARATTTTSATRPHGITRLTAVPLGKTVCAPIHP